MKFSSFAPLAGGFAFSAKPPHGQRIYETLRDSMGETYETDFAGRQQARLFAQARCLGAAQYQLDRAANNRSPATATELLPAIEHDYQIVPTPGSSIAERRRVATARAKVTRGAREEAVVDALRTLLGGDFVAYEVVKPANVIKWPRRPGTIGVFARAGTQKKVLRLLENVSQTGEPLSVAYEAIAGTDAPVAGETYTVGPDVRDPNIEQIAIQEADASRVTATFARAHVAGSFAARPHPLWLSTKRFARIVVTSAAAANPEVRRQINEQMKRQLRAVSQWSIVMAGSFTLNSSTLGMLGTIGLG